MTWLYGFLLLLLMRSCTGSGHLHFVIQSAITVAPNQCIYVIFQSLTVCLHTFPRLTKYVPIKMFCLKTDQHSVANAVIRLPVSAGIYHLVNTIELIVRVRKSWNAPMASLANT